MVYIPTPGLGGGDFEVGSDVLAPWDAGWLYPAVVVERHGADAIVAYWEGDSARVPVAKLRPIAYREGDRVFANWKNVNDYEEGVIKRRVGGGVQVALANGNIVWTTWAKCRVAMAAPIASSDPNDYR
jgi:hypothetical protein